MGNDTNRFRMTKLRRTANAVIGGLTKYGIGPSKTRLLTTRGRKSGFLRTIPVNLVENEQGRFLVSPYGEVGWARIRAGPDADGFLGRLGGQCGRESDPTKRCNSQGECDRLFTGCADRGHAVPTSTDPPIDSA